MNEPAILKDKHAVVFGASGSIGAAVARTFAAQGAEVFLVGRRKDLLDAVAAKIHNSGGNSPCRGRGRTG